MERHWEGAAQRPGQVLTGAAEKLNRKFDNTSTEGPVQQGFLAFTESSNHAHAPLHHRTFFFALPMSLIDALTYDVETYFSLSTHNLHDPFVAPSKLLLEGIFISVKEFTSLPLLAVCFSDE